MRVCFIALFLFVSCIGASAQQNVLISTPPVYQLGDSFVGTYGQAGVGITGEVLQSVRAGRTGKIFLEKQIVLQNGAVIMHSMLDPATSLGTIMYPLKNVMVQVRASTCTPDHVFPVVIGRQVTCSALKLVDGVQKNETFQYSYLDVKKAPDGSIAEICGTQTVDGQQGAVDTCTTADGKWTTSITIVNGSAL